MAALTLDDIIKASGGELLSGGVRTFNSVSIDSRTANTGDIFFALRGEKFDGHDFLVQALLNCSGAVVDAKPVPLPQGKTIIYVKDSLRALQDVAHFIRMKRGIPVIAITGSNGKTTTKEMVASLLSRRFKVLKNEGNLNNHIGLPLSLTRLEPDDDIAVLEMGMNAKGEIRRLCEIAAPSHGVITNIGSAHLGKLGSYEAVRDAKLEIMKGLSVAALNSDDNYLMQEVLRDKLVNKYFQSKGFNGELITFSVNSDSQVTAKEIRTTEKGSDFILEIKYEGSVPVSLGIHGMFNVYNALAAAAVCHSLGITIKEIKASLESFKAVPMRFEVVRQNGITVINDSYNANPSSMEESVKELTHLRKKGRLVAVLGDMLELQGFSEDAHKAVGRMVSDMGVDIFIAIGEKMKLATEEIKDAKGRKPVPEVYAYRDADEAGEKIKDILQRGDTVLIKGSRAVSLEKIIARLTHAV